MKILFLDPAWDCEGCSSGGSKQGNIGLEYIAGIAKAAGHDVELYEPPLSPLSFSKAVTISKKVDVVAISSMTWNSASAINLAKKIRKAIPKIRLAVGGVGPTGMPDYFSPYFDVVIAGEGEKVFLDWLNGARKEKIIYAERDSEWDGRVTPLRRKNILTNSKMRGIWPIAYKKQIVTNILYAKGCYNNCSFCCSPLIWKRKVVWRDPAIVAKELLMLAEYGVNSVDFLDATFNAHPEKVLRLCDELIATGVSKKIKWTAMLDPAKNDSLKILPAMERAGCIKVGFGLEDPTPKMRASFLKSAINIKNCYRTMKIASDLGMLVRAYLIIGAPEQAECNIDAIAETLQSWPIDEPRISIFTPFPGTPIWDGLQDKIIERDFSKYDTNNPIIKSHWDREELLNIRHELTRNFYTGKNYQKRRKEKIKKIPNIAIGYEQFEEIFLRPKGYI